MEKTLLHDNCDCPLCRGLPVIPGKPTKQQRIDMTERKAQDEYNIRYGGRK